MANHLIDELVMASIAQSIRNKLGVTTKYKPSDMPNAIESISSGVSMESGTFIGNGSNTITIPVSSKKTTLIMCGEGTLADDYNNTPYVNVFVFGKEGYGICEVYTNYNGTNTGGGMTSVTSWTEEGINNNTYIASYILFKDHEINLRTRQSGTGSQKFLNNINYNWIAF